MADTSWGGDQSLLSNPAITAASTSMFGPAGAMAPAMMQIFGGLFGNEGWKNPSDEAMKYLNSVQSTITPYFQPYIDAGRQAMGGLMPQYQSLISNPANLMNNIGSQFQSSPGYQYNVQQATNAANQAAAAGGMLGSPAEQQSLAQNISGMANQDFYNYLQNALGLYGTGLQGLEGINQLGYGASTGLAEDLATALQNQAMMKYMGTMSQNMAGGASTGGILGGIGSAIGGLF